MMGRKRKYHTKEEQREANKIASKKYYWSHKEECDKKQWERNRARKKSLETEMSEL